MKREFLQTGDGSYTIHLPQWNEQYHSKHGAIQEAQHVFIEAGLQFYVKATQERSLSILEIGFGTGLNALLTQQWVLKQSCKIDYTGIEAYPVTLEEIAKLNYPELLQIPELDFKKLHEVAWGEYAKISKQFSLKKEQIFFSEISYEDAFNIIYFDAFGARVQPELWTQAIFQKMYDALQPNGVLVTYAAKGSVRRAMQDIGFRVERLQGPPGKRHMLRAIKN